MIKFKLRECIADKEFREDRRITMLEIAETTGIGRITLSRMLKPGAVMRTDTLDKLCEYLQCQIEDLVEYVEANPGRDASGEKGRR